MRLFRRILNTVFCVNFYLPLTHIIFTLWPVLIWHLISNKSKKKRLKINWSWQVSCRVKKFPKDLWMGYWSTVSIFKMNPRLNHLIEILLRKFTFFWKIMFFVTLHLFRLWYFLLGWIKRSEDGCNIPLRDLLGTFLPLTLKFKVV